MGRGTSAPSASPMSPRSASSQPSKEVRMRALAASVSVKSMPRVVNQSAGTLSAQ